MKIVFDSNVLVSAVILPNTVPASSFDTILDKGYHFLISKPVFNEITDILMRTKFDRYISQEKRITFLEVFLNHSISIDTTSKILDCRDPKDNKYLELAIDGKADAIITGDSDLLILNPYHRISIITPSVFLDRYS